MRPAAASVVMLDADRLRPRRSDVPVAPPAVNDAAGDDTWRRILRGLCRAEHLAMAERLSRQTRAAVPAILIARGLLRPSAYVRALARETHLANLDEAPLALRAFHPMPPPHQLIDGRAPVPVVGGGAVLAAETTPLATLRRLALALGPQRGKLGLVSRQTLIDALSLAYGARLTRLATHALLRRSPQLSAASGVRLWQIAALVALAGASIGAGVIAPRATLDAIGAALSLLLCCAVLLRLAALPIGRGAAPVPPPLAPHALPRYSVLVPLFRESAVLPDLVMALRRLDYPPDKLDIKLVLEACDTATIAAARALKLPGSFDIIVVPDSQPRTKPKALNYAMQFATGELLVVYDAEDRPEGDQLRKAAATFAAAAPDVVCLQARLEFDNAHENWLAAQFAIEYLSLFRGVLPFYDRARLPMPLGGTSNHFRIAALRAAGGWDPFNVTEDADLGLRLARAGLRCRMLDSTTFEEAACQPGNWVRQRTRWLKGWMQTYGVHMRAPRQLMREIGLRGVFALQAHVAAVIVSALVHPLSYVVLALDAADGELFAGAGGLAQQSLTAIAVFNLAVGYAATALLGATAIAARREWRLLPHLVLIPLYWLMLSAAAYRAVHQLVTRPYYWDKTEHGISAARAPSS